MLAVMALLAVIGTNSRYGQYGRMYRVLVYLLVATWPVMANNRDIRHPHDPVSAALKVDQSRVYL